MILIIMMLLYALFLYGLYRLIIKIFSSLIDSLTDNENYVGEIILLIISYFILDNHFGYKKNYTVVGMFVVMIITLLINMIIGLTYKITGIMLYGVVILYLVFYLSYRRMALNMIPAFVAAAAIITMMLGSKGPS